MRLCVVGNGPSAPKHAESIDKCDVVVRVNSWPCDTAGRKWTVWASAFYPSIGQFAMGMHKLSPRIPKVSELWIFGEQPILDGLPLRADVKRDHMPAVRRAELEELLGARPTGGFMAVIKALEREPTELCLTGFDPEGGHWWTGGGLEWGGARCAEVHNLLREHSYYADLVAGRECFGLKRPVRVEWWR